MPVEKRPANPLPKGARAGSRPRPHRVVDGETLETVAKKHGIAINRLIQHALQQTSHNVSAAARLLGVSRDYVRYRLAGQKQQPSIPGNSTPVS